MEYPPIDDRPDPSATGAYRPVAAVLPGERFAPGELLAGRYRVVAPLGRGGMGEVYRADDLTLGQPTALKFLPQHLASDPERLSRFRKEVAAARRVSHPHVCRVYDIAEHDGQSFLTMEFVDGEDLASVLKRLGRVPEEKGVEIARQLCAALGAVHDQGLLHRDLKPANVMLDGRGRVRLTDFGLAAAAADLSATDARSGTPVYQSPEQLGGKDVTARSDIYALGLVLYELFTGKRAFAGSSRAETPSKPSSHVSNLNPAVERVILRCLEPDPAHRPRSATEVLAGLPGGDPLAAALAAGETPSPQLVADAGAVGLVPLRTGFALMAVVFASLAVCAVAADSIGLYRRGPLDPPALQLDRARALLTEVGYPQRQPQARSFYRCDESVLRGVARADLSVGRWAGVPSGRPAVVVYNFRESPESFRPVVGTQALDGSWESPPHTVPGMAGVQLDGAGRLVTLIAVPPQHEVTVPAAAPPNWWVPLVRSAGLESAGLVATAPEWTPPTACDERRAWTGHFPERPEVPIRVEAAAYRGRPVYFQVIGDWTPADRVRVEDSGTSGLVFLLVAALLGCVLAVRNIRRGRADLRGAALLGGTVLVVPLLVWLVLGVHSGDTIGESLLVMDRLGEGGVWCVLVTLLYLGMEPAIRRRWPWRSVGWNRLLAGRWRDPLVGRDLLVGVAFGAASMAYTGLLLSALAAAGCPPPPSPIANPPVWATEVGSRLALCIYAALVFYSIPFVLNLALRREWPTWLAFIAVGTLASCDPAINRGALWLPVMIAWALPLVSVSAYLMARYGILSIAGRNFALFALTMLPITYDWNAWYFRDGLIGLGLVAGLAAFCCWTATGGKRLFAEGFFGDD